MKKILWLSRHVMTEEQRSELETAFGDIAITQVNATVPNVHVPFTDSDGNGHSPLKELVALFDVACVVLPINILGQLLPFAKAAGVPVLQAKNRRIPTGNVNEDGEQIFDFFHDGWHVVEEVKIVTRPLLA